MHVHLICREGSLKPEYKKMFSEWEYVKVSFLDYLHSKCYVNDKKCIVTSLNLYDYSQRNNLEMGFLLSATDDKKLYEEVKAECGRIIRQSKDFKKNTRINDVPIVEKNTIKNQKRQTTSVLAKNLNTNTKKLLTHLEAIGFLEIINNKQELTKKGIAYGEKKDGKHGIYFIWQYDDLSIYKI